MIKICIVDDHEVVRKGLKNALSEVSDFKVVGEASNGKELFNVLTEDVHVLVLDLSMPGRHGLELLEDLKSRFPKVAVVVFTIHNEASLAVGAIKAGAAGYLTKDCLLSELIAAIRKVAGGHKYINEAIAEKLAYHIESNRKDRPHESLSPRELQVMLMIAAGKSIKDIAQELSLSAQTITTYRTRTLGKLGMQTNADLTRYMMEHKLEL
jgi:DNA-binding NarL/FixJ family response regulator